MGSTGCGLLALLGSAPSQQMGEKEGGAWSQGGLVLHLACPSGTAAAGGGSPAADGVCRRACRGHRQPGAGGDAGLEGAAGSLRGRPPARQLHSRRPAIPQPGPGPALLDGWHRWADWGS